MLSVDTAIAKDGIASKVDQLFAEFNKPDSPGCSVGIIHNGTFVYKKSFGSGSLELGVPLTSESIFYMGSISKQFTAASIVLAGEQGYLSLDDDVRKYVPELPNYGHPITLRQMLHQTSGFRDFLALADLSGRNYSDLTSPSDILKLIARQKALNNVPGEEWIYSNSNYFLLGEVIRRATHKSLAQFAAENIFQPLGMAHTLFYDDNTRVIRNRVAAYAPGKNREFVVDWSTTYDIVGGGGLMSSVEDMLLWDRNFYSNKLGKGTLLKELQSHGVLNNGSQINYAMGLSLGDYRSLPTVEHNGAMFGYRTELLRFPKQRFSAILLCNTASATTEGLARKIANIYLKNDFTPEATPAKLSPTLPEAAAFAGTYLDRRTKTIYEFTADQGNLMGWGAALRRIDANRFYDLGSNVITFLNNDGTMHASLEIPGELYFSGDRIVRDIRLGADELPNFAGMYHSEELDADYELFVDAAKLMVTVGGRQPAVLHAVTQNAFYADHIGTLVFQRDAMHQVPGFSLYSQAARGISFTKANRIAGLKRSFGNFLASNGMWCL